MKGETVGELTAAAKVMRSKVTTLSADALAGKVLLDTCGTGGDSKGSFNVSTVASFVIAGGGVNVAKHGNRAVSSKCGSADLIEALGINIKLPIKRLEECLAREGFVFLFAPLFHSAMKYAAAPRKEIALRTIFNILGPLTNPAGAGAQLIGVYDGELTETIADVLRNLKCNHALVVHGSDGLDEITISGKSKITELKGNEITTYYLHPQECGLNLGSIEQLRAESASESALLAREVLHGKKGAPRDIVLLNSAAGFIAAGMASDFKQAVQMAADSIDSGKAMAVVKRVAAFTNR
jgi:anthranilate phosphoribosyltransferase